MALFFNSSNTSSYIAGPIPHYLSTEFTFGGWIYIPTGAAAVVLLTVGSGVVWGLQRFTDGLLYCISMTDYRTQYRAAGVSYTADTWFHYMATKSGTTWRVFINGVYTATGSTPNIVPASTAVFFKNPLGAMAEWIIADRVLTDNEIAMLGTGFTPKCLSKKPTAYYPMYGKGPFVLNSTGVPEISNGRNLVSGVPSIMTSFPHPRIVHPGGGGGGFKSAIPVSVSQSFIKAIEYLNKPVSQSVVTDIENKKTINADINALRANASTPTPPFRASRIPSRMLFADNNTYLDENYVQWFFESQIVPIAANHVFDIDYSSNISPASFPMLPEWRLYIGTKDFGQVVEILTTPNFNTPSNIEMLVGVWRNDIFAEASNEELIQYDAIYDIEYLGETVGGDITADYLLDIETLTSIAQDEDFNLDYLFSLTDTNTFAVEELLSVRDSKIFDIDNLIGVSDNNVLDVENLTSVVDSSVFDVENLVNVLGTRVFDQEYLGNISNGNIFDVENLIRVLANDNLGIDYLINVSYDRPFNIDFLSEASTITSDYEFCIAYMQSINSSSVVDIENLQSLIDNNILDIEYAGSSLAQPFVFDIENLVRVSKNIQNIEEILTYINNSSVFDIEARGNIAKNFIFDLDNSINIALTYNLDIEILFGVKSNVESAISYLESVRQSQTFAIDFLSLEPEVIQYWRLRSRGTQWVLRSRGTNWILR